MAVLGGSDWRKGFPFTASLLRSGRAGARTGVTAPVIPDDGRPVNRPADSTDRPTPLRAATGKAPPEALALALTGPDPLGPSRHAGMRRFVPRRASLRLLPLGAFLWGTNDSPPQPRTRPEHVLIWVTQGGLALRWPGSRALLRPGDLRYIPSGTAFAALPGVETQGHVLLLPHDLVRGLDPGLPAQGLAGRVGQQAEPLSFALQDLMAEAARDVTEPARSKALRQHLSLLALRLQRLDPPAETGLDPGPASADHALVERFLAEIAPDPGRQVTLAELAAQMGTSLTALDRACLAARGRRAIDLLHGLRLDRAAEMLRHSELPVHRISQMLGYSSLAHFTRAFVAATGRPPDAFRMQIRRGSEWRGDA
ncbi:helix-turn-helix transcriptional regulator [Paracoccus sp. (in: a-proteobacteria)]|uniref:helix-turn-helix transcriptional regulator n=1 Tax=Paracoccus sp. TaxID=267 RepID=UPI00272B16E6|nr:AraC family transcriptional regulator [Paracoccus sp. (in: a-proteobacteria)]